MADCEGKQTVILSVGCLLASVSYLGPSHLPHRRCAFSHLAEPLGKVWNNVLRGSLNSFWQRWGEKGEKGRKRPSWGSKIQKNNQTTACTKREDFGGDFPSTSTGPIPQWLVNGPPCVSSDHAGLFPASPGNSKEGWLDQSLYQRSLKNKTTQKNPNTTGFHSWR